MDWGHGVVRRKQQERRTLFFDLSTFSETVQGLADKNGTVTVEDLLPGGLCELDVLDIGSILQDRDQISHSENVFALTITELHQHLESLPKAA